MGAKRKYFGTDGIRGRAGEHPLTEEFAYRLGRALAHMPWLEDEPTKTVLLAHDGRPSAPMLEIGLTKGLAEVGMEVADLGLLPTPGLARLVKKSGSALGIMLSASHNPAPDNGIKIIRSSGYKLSDEDELHIEKLIEEETTNYNNISTRQKQGASSKATNNSVEQYVDLVLESVPNLDLSGVSLVLDCANGASGTSSPMALEKLGAKVIAHHQKSGESINDNCGSTYPENIERLTQQEGADVGISHDGDADRVVLCDERAKTLNGDEVMAILATHAIERSALAKNTLVATSMSNVGLEQCLARAGGKLLRTDVGDRYVLQALQEHSLNLGGEQSGHFIFLDHSPSGDGLLAALQVLAVRQETGRPLSELRQCINLAPQVLLNVEVPAKPELSSLPSFTTACREIEESLGAKGRLLPRYSGTENKIRLLLEGPDQKALEEMGERLSKICLSEIEGTLNS